MLEIGKKLEKKKKKNTNNSFLFLIIKKVSFYRISFLPFFLFLLPTGGKFTARRNFEKLRFSFSLSMRYVSLTCLLLKNLDLPSNLNCVFDVDKHMANHRGMSNTNITEKQSFNRTLPSGGDKKLHVFIKPRNSSSIT